MMDGMKIGLIDVDAESRGKVTFPNLALMKISAWHKANGDEVEWHRVGTHYHMVYISKVFGDEYTKENLPFIIADEIIRGGSGYAISVENGREVYRKGADEPLPDDVEHIMPDYSIYNIHDDAYGFLTKGCPRGCYFCHVAGMQGRMSHTVARLSEFWNGQKTVHLLDPNILACKDWETHFDDLIESKAYVDFSQGLDIRLMTREKMEKLKGVRFKIIHFAWDNPKDDLKGRFEELKAVVPGCTKSKTSVYILTNFDSTIEQDIERVEFIKSLKFQPYVMVYRKETAPKEIKKLQRYANNPYVCWAVPTFAEYNASKHSDRFGKTGMTHKATKTIDSLNNG